MKGRTCFKIIFKIVIVLSYLNLVGNGIVNASDKDSTPAMDVEGQFPNQKGFPIDVEGNINSSVVVADVDGDGRLELCFNTEGTWMTHLVKSNGTPFNAAWPVDHGGVAPSLNDFDCDGDLEIVTLAWEIYVWRLDGSIEPGWPYIFPSANSHSSPCVVDMNNDKLPELSTDYSNSSVYFTILNNSGFPLSGYPVQLTNGIFQIPAAVDLNNDGVFEVVTAVQGAQSVSIVAWDLEGRVFEGNWNFDLTGHGLGRAISGITSADVDGDHRPEIMFATDYDPGGNNYRHAVVLNHDRNFATGWPKIIHSHSYGGLTAGDLNGDGFLEVACATKADYDDNDDFYAMVYVWDGRTGSNFPGWPIIVPSYNCDSNVIIGDVDGDGNRELLATFFGFPSGPTMIYAWNSDATILSGFPITLTGYSSMGSSPFIADLDHDGDVEIGIGVNGVIGNPSRVYVWDLPYKYRPDCQDWPQYHHDPGHSGNYHYPEGLPILPQVPTLTSLSLLVLLVLLGCGILLSIAKTSSGEARNDRTNQD